MSALESTREVAAIPTGGGGTIVVSIGRTLSTGAQVIEMLSGGARKTPASIWVGVRAARELAVALVEAADAIEAERRHGPRPASAPPPTPTAAMPPPYGWPSNPSARARVAAWRAQQGGT
jgi:hypothetical protein